jgi:hypothetical protein
MPSLRWSANRVRDLVRGHFAFDLSLDKAREFLLYGDEVVVGRSAE